MKKPAKKMTTAAAIKRIYISQADIPKHSLEDAITLAKALYEDFNGEAVPHQLANAMSISPTSSAWQSLTGAAVAYGLTEGGYNATEIRLTDLGSRIVALREEGDDAKAIAEAALQPRILRQFFEKYNKGKFPQEIIGTNVLVTMGVPKDRAKQVCEIARKNGLLAGYITNTTTGLYVALGTRPSVSGLIRKSDEKEPPEIQEIPADDPAPQTPIKSTVASPPNRKVFITHGKNRSIVEQLKEILKFGKHEPVVAVEHETPSKPVSGKVLEDMRGCFAAVIHVESEEELLTASGDKVQKINENVLIEIGASMALYSRNFVLLVRKGIHLPSNLQGLYRCEYEGDKLDSDATMKLLKAFNEFQ